MFCDPETAINHCQRRHRKRIRERGESVTTLRRGERENLKMKDDVVVIWQHPKFTFSWEFHTIMRTSTRLFEL